MLKGSRFQAHAEYLQSRCCTCCQPHRGDDAEVDRRALVTKHLLAVAVHLHFGYEFSNYKTRENQISQVLQDVAEGLSRLKTTVSSTVLFGDFNTRHEEEPTVLKLIQGALGKKKTKRLSKENEKTIIRKNNIKRQSQDNYSRRKQSKGYVKQTLNYLKNKNNKITRTSL